VPGAQDDPFPEGKIVEEGAKLASFVDLWILKGEMIVDIFFEKESK